MARHVILVVTGQQGLAPAGAARTAEGVGLAPETPVELRAVVNIRVKVEQRRAAVTGGSCRQGVNALDELSALRQLSPVARV